MGSILGSLPAMAIAQYQPDLRPFDYGRALTQATQIAGGQLTNQTALLALEDLRRQQASAAAQRQFLAAHPDVVLGGGGSLLGSLTAASPPGAITQGPLPGQPGATQTIGAPQDLSQFATGTPPQSTLGSPQGQPQRPDPLRALMQTDPEAALKVMEARHQVQTRVLGMREKYAEYLARAVQGATDQASWDAGRQEVVRLDPQAAAQLPPVFSPQARDQVVQQALSVKDRLTLQQHELEQQVETYKANLQARTALAKEQIVPKYTGDAQRDSLIHSEMQRQGLTGNPPQAVLDTVEQRIQQGKVDVSASQGAGQAQQAGQAAYNKERMTQAANMGSSAQSSLSTLQQMQTLMDEGVYGNSWGDVFNMGLYQARLNQGDQQAVRTQQLRAYGNQLIKDAAEGKLGAGVSNKDVDIFREAVGNFQRAKNLDEMRESLSQMQGAARRMIGQANRMQQTFQSGGRLPDFGDESHVQSVSRKDFDAFVAKHPEKTRDQWRRLFTADGIVFRE